MARLKGSIYNRRRRSGKGFWIFLILIILVIGGGAYYLNWKTNNSPLLKAEAISYLLIYEDSEKTDLYFIRVNNANRRLFIVKSPDNVYYATEKILITSKMPEQSVGNFERLLEITSAPYRFVITINKQSLGTIINKLKGTKLNIDELFKKMQTRNSNLFDPILAYTLTPAFREAGNTNINQDGVLALLVSFSKYAITSYDKLQIRTIMSAPIIVELPDSEQSYERNYIDEKSLEEVKKIIE